MADDTRTSEAPFLKRWSQRKLAASREATAGAAATVEPTTPAAVPPPAPAAPTTPAAQIETPALPAVESLTFESDFSAFLQPGVGEGLRRQALRKLFADPRFNVMDGLDVYIDDYGKSEPIPPEIVRQLNQAKYLFDPPKTRVNAQGHVEDEPVEAGAAPEAETVADREPLTPAATLADAPADESPSGTPLPPAPSPNDHA